MKNLYEIWQSVSQESREIKKNYHTTLIKISVHGKSAFVTSIKDCDKKFEAGFEELFPDKIVPVRMMVRFKNEDEVGNEGESSTVYTVSIQRGLKNEGSSYVARMLRANGKPTRAEERNYVEEEFKKKYVREFDPKDIKCWKELIDMFDLN